MFLLSDLEALLWFVFYLVLALACAYTIGFLIFYRACRLDPSSAIRMSITVCLGMLLILLCFSSAAHAPYVAAWSDITLLLNLLVMALPIIAIIIAAWVIRPKEINQ